MVWLIKYQVNNWPKRLLICHLFNDQNVYLYVTSSTSHQRRVLWWSTRLNARYELISRLMFTSFSSDKKSTKTKKNIQRLIFILHNLRIKWGFKNPHFLKMPSRLISLVLAFRFLILRFFQNAQLGWFWVFTIFKLLKWALLDTVHNE